MRRLIIASLFAIVLSACGQPAAPANPAAGAAAPAESAAAPATGTPKATSTPKPTNTPAPTRTPRPTSTPKPTRTPAPTATATPLPEPVRLSGSGQTVTEPFTPPESVSRITFTHSGRRNFIVKAYDADGDESYLVNEIGNYSGSRALYGKSSTFLEIDADGDWTVLVEPINVQLDAASGLSGTGDQVSGLFMPTKEGPVPFVFTHNGESNFIVQIDCKGGRDYVQNEIGQVNGSAVAKFSEGPCLWDVQADGEWTISPK